MPLYQVKEVTDRTGFPRYMFHERKEPKVVNNENELKLLGPGWNATYTHVEYPHRVYSSEGPTKIVHSKSEAEKLNPKIWRKTPFEDVKPVVEKTSNELENEIANLRQQLEANQLAQAALQAAKV